MTENPPDPPEGEGGSGPARADWVEAPSRSDLALLARAARRGWDVPDQTKRKAVRRMDQIVDEEYLHELPGGGQAVAGPRLAIAAARALAAFDAIDQKERALDLRVREFESKLDADADAPADQDADLLREALEHLRRPEG